MPEPEKTLPAPPTTKFRVLGPLEVVGDDGRPVDLGRPKQRALVATLIVARNHMLPCERLIDLLWPDDPPAQAGASLRSYVSNVRRILEPQRGPHQVSNVLVTQPPGYALRIDRGDLDAAVFEDLACEGSRLLAEGRARPAFDRFTEALALWRGPALADVASCGPGRAEAERLEELRLMTVAGRLEAALALGRHVEAVAELQSLITMHPLREGLWRLLMIALYRSNRQADAVQAFQRARATLVEVGLEPGPELRSVEADILVHAPAVRGRAVGHHRRVCPHGAVSRRARPVGRGW